MKELPLNQVLCGDCVEIMSTFPDDSVDLVATDPNYGLKFIGLNWDKTLPPKEAFKQMNRVLKPGAISFVMSSPRQDLMARMILLLEDAGLKTDVSFIDWIYKTGFPKAYDVSKGIDRRPNRLQKNPFKNYCNQQRRKLGLSLNQINERGGWATTGGGVASSIMGDKMENLLPSIKTYEKLKKILQLDDRFDKIIEEAEREIVGFKTINSDKWTAESRRRGSKGTYSIPITASSTNLAKKWDGWKSLSGLKPAHEPILMAYKPLSEPTIVDNVLQWGTGAINVDACRIPFQSVDDKEGSKHNWKPDSDYPANETVYEYGSKKLSTHQSSKGRFPANLLVSDRAIDTRELSKSGLLESHHTRTEKRNVYGEYKGTEKISTYGDIGDQSRYFDLDAWAEHHGFLDVPKPDKSERDFGLSQRNIHPTVKPIKLMAYLIELGCPPDGVVLDPFMGSGSTCIAAKQLTRKFIGIEIVPEYVEIAKARISAHPTPFDWLEFLTNSNGDESG